MKIKKNYKLFIGVFFVFLVFFIIIFKLLNNNELDTSNNSNSKSDFVYFYLTQDEYGDDQNISYDFEGKENYVAKYECGNCFDGIEPIKDLNYVNNNVLFRDKKNVVLLNILDNSYKIFDSKNYDLIKGKCNVIIDNGGPTCQYSNLGIILYNTYYSDLDCSDSKNSCNFNAFYSIDDQKMIFDFERDIQYGIAINMGYDFDYLEYMFCNFSDTCDGGPEDYHYGLVRYSIKDRNYFEIYNFNGEIFNLVDSKLPGFKNNYKIVLSYFGYMNYKYLLFDNHGSFLKEVLYTSKINENQIAYADDGKSFTIINNKNGKIIKEVSVNNLVSLNKKSYSEIINNSDLIIRDYNGNELWKIDISKYQYDKLYFIDDPWNDEYMKIIFTSNNSQIEKVILLDYNYPDNIDF